MALKKNASHRLPFIPLKDPTPGLVTDLLEHTPRYGATEFRRLVEDAIGAIHQLPGLLKNPKVPDLDLKDIEAYFGRSSAASGGRIGSNVANRFRTGRDERGHEYGMVLAATTLRASLNFERFGIALIEELKRRDGLCIANRSIAQRGPVGSTEPGFIYMTFRIKASKEHASVLGPAEIRDAVREIVDAVKGDDVPVARQVIREAATVGVSRANDTAYTGSHVLILGARE